MARKLLFHPSVLLSIGAGAVLAGGSVIRSVPWPLWAVWAVGSVVAVRQAARDA